MVWGCMASSSTGMLYTCEGRMNSTIYTNMLDQVYRSSLTKIFNNNIPSDVIFQQDNAPCHTSKVSIGWFEKKWITVMTWPPQSPDLNPIENLWSHLGKRVRMHKCSSKKELEAKLHEELQKTDPTTGNNLVNNMQNWINFVIKAKGGHTKYWLLLLMFTPLFLTFKYISLNHNFDFSLVLHNLSQGCIIYCSRLFNSFLLMFKGYFIVVVLVIFLICLCHWTYIWSRN